MSARGKPRSSSRVGSLLPAQRALLAKWLLDEKLSYGAAAARAKLEFGASLHRGSVMRFFNELVRSGNSDQIQRGKDHAAATIEELRKNPDEIIQAVLAVAGQVAFEVAVKAANGKKPDLNYLREALRLMTAARKEGRDEQKILLEREKWEFDVARTCAAHQAKINAILNDQSLNEDQRLQAIRQSLFGKPDAAPNQPPPSSSP